MKSIVTCKITIDYDKILEKVKAENPKAEMPDINEIHIFTVKNFKEFVLDEFDQDIEDGFMQVEFTDKIED